MIDYFLLSTFLFNLSWGIWSPQACNFLHLKHTLHSHWKKILFRDSAVFLWKNRIFRWLLS